MGRSNSTTAFYTYLLLSVAGLGGLLYGIDVGIISGALLYLEKTVDLTVSQTSILVAAVLGGSTLSSLIAGFMADWFGRKKMIIVSGVLFVLSIVLIVLSQGFWPLLFGRILQGLSGGIIGVVIPLHLAESLPPSTRGRGSAIFQFLLTLGIVVAAGIGVYYSRGAEQLIAAANGNSSIIRAAQDHAWRGMFLSVIYPGTLYLLSTFFVSESPRWLHRRGRREEARTALEKIVSPAEAERELLEMDSVVAPQSGSSSKPAFAGSLLQRRYIVPFVLACVILGCNQGTGINSVLGYLSVILKQAGMTATEATRGDFAVKLLNCLTTVIAVALVDRKGRKFLLMLGTGCIVLALGIGGSLFRISEAKRIEVADQVRTLVQGNHLSVTPEFVRDQGGDSSLTVLYNYGDGEKIATLSANDKEALQVAPEKAKPNAPLKITRAFVAPLPSRQTAWLIALSLAFFIAGYAVGPGVVVWLALSELMPTRIRSVGMGIALLINQGVSTTIAGVFLPVVSSHGYAAMFYFWAACSLVYFLTATFFLPETKGRTLEEIEAIFAREKHSEMPETAR
ncbi:sugar porter family MFS transporter [Terriglobus albidus]|uniref:Sugar porter family MFS transporter n=1 Tax=Terriglobus albidus TaxID=1592106 RepID=A0A5B9EDT2_9BACT|nr:MFS transporter [Terriglobus albidus]QEE29814.1 sugar porter family MFS transporter [Terriglobus albidus]